MDLELIISSAVSIVTVLLYVIALWIGDHRTISVLAGASNFTIALVVTMIGLAFALGVSANLIVNPSHWLHAVGRLVQLV